METKKMGWKTVKLGEVLKQVRQEVELDPQKTYKQVTIKLHRKGVTLRGMVQGDQVGSKQFLARQNQFIISRIDARNGAYGIVPPELEEAIVTNDFLLFDTNQQVETPFLNLFSNSQFFDFECKKASEGTTNRVRLKIDKFLQIEIPLPPLSEQRRIAARLQALKGKIEEVQRLRGEQVKAVEVIENNFLTSLFADLKKEFGEQLIDKVCDLERGRFSHRPRNAPHLYENGKYPFIQTGEVSRAKGGKILYSKTLNEYGLKVSKLFKPPTVLITIAANIGHTAILDYEACFPDSVVSIRPKKGLDVYFLEYFLRTQKDYLNSVAPQSAQKNINIQILSTIQIPVPPLEAQRRIVAEIQAFENQIDTLKSIQSGQLSELEGLFPGVLEQAFRGE